MLTLLLAGTPAAQADPLTGTVHFGGLWYALDEFGNVTFNFEQANGVDVLSAVVLGGEDAPTGDFEGVAGPVSYSDFAFDPPSTPIVPLWSVGGFTFDLLEMNVQTQTSSLLHLTGSGVVSSSTPGTETPFYWEFQGQPTGFGFNAFVNDTGPNTTSLPEPSTALLLGIGGFAMTLYRRPRRL
jgi:hypothetical protein